MKPFRWVTMCATAAVVSGTVPMQRALAERVVARRVGTAVTQMSAGQGLEHERAVETEVMELLSNGRYIAVLDAVKEVSSPSALLLNVEGVAYEHLGGLDNARANYEESIKLNPKYSNAYNNLGTVFYARHNNRMAMKMYKKAIRLDSKSASAYKNLGAAYFHEGKYQRGAEAYEEAITIDPTVLDRQGLLMDAEDRGTLAAMNYFLAELCAKSGKNDIAIGYLRRAIAAGFNDYGKLKKDEAFAELRQSPEFPMQSR